MPIIYEGTAKILGTKPVETAVFEDVIYAIKVAKQAGLMTFALEDIANYENQQEMKQTADYDVKDFFTQVICNIRRLKIWRVQI